MTRIPDELKLHIRRPVPVPKKTTTKKAGNAPTQPVCDKSAAPHLLLTDMKFLLSEPNLRCPDCEEIQNRAIQAVKLKRGEGPVRPKDLQKVYAHELTG